ncbi:MAG: hypothetical protein ACOYYJ_04890 [Chloroflexota bacterium]
MNVRGRARRDLAILLVILFVGFILMFLAGQFAVGLVPAWWMEVHMRSNLTPNYQEIAQPIPPLSADILTLPVWYDIFLTPNATLPPGTPPTQPLPPTLPPSSAPPTSIPTDDPTSLPPTAPPPPRPTKPPPPPPTDPPPPLNIDLQVDKTDGAATYTPGDDVIYTITVSNNGPDAVDNATIADAIPAPVLTWTWACAAQNGGASGCDGIVNSAANFADTVDLPNGASIVYTVTANTSPAAATDLSNTAVVTAPAGYTDTIPGNNSQTDTDTPTLSADLEITKSDGTDIYTAGNPIQYTITILNGGPSNAIGFDVEDVVPVEISVLTVTCAPAGTADCGVDNTLGNTVAFTGASLAAGGGNQITITIQGTVDAGASGDLSNTADIIIPGGAGFSDPDLGDNSGIDTDGQALSLPYGNIGAAPDGVSTNFATGSVVTFNISVQVIGNPSWDLVYYEYPNGSCGGVLIDWVIIEVGDGNTWYTVFNWGDGFVDGNAITSAAGLPEDDHRDLCDWQLYNSTGIAIDLDGVVPPGTYPYVRFTAPPVPPPGDTDGHIEIDAIETLP